MVRHLLRSLHSGPIAVQLRRFVAVGTVAAGVQMVLLWLLVDYADVYYLLGAVIAIEITIVFQYVLNNAWTFQSAKNTGRREFFVGLCKTNVVRGSAIPIQIGILYVLVDRVAVFYLVANAVAILLSGIYRYVLDARWTWG